MKRPRKRPAAPPEKLGAQPDGGYEKSHGYGPSHGGPSGPGDAPATAPARATKDRGEVLLVDDDADFRAILGEVLKAEGCTVREAPNGQQALDMARAHTPDLILTARI